MHFKIFILFVQYVGLKINADIPMLPICLSMSQRTRKDVADDIKWPLQK